jgi:uncharacterized DUF497 family protein
MPLPYNETEAFSSDPVVIDADIIWDLEDDPDGNVQHIAEHGITVEEVEEVLHDPRTRTSVSRRTGRPQAFGSTSTGKYITVIWDEVADDPRTIYPVTAYEVPPPQGRQR